MALTLLNLRTPPPPPAPTVVKQGIAKAERQFKAAMNTRLTGDWSPLLQSADQDLWRDLWRLRARARVTCANNPIAAKYLKLVTKNTIGPAGIQFEARVPTKRKRKDGTIYDDKINAELERCFTDWSRRKNCTVTGQQTFTEAQALYIKQVARDGEALVRIVKYPDNPYRFALQFLDPDQLDHNYMDDKMPNGHTIRMGVELDQWGRPVAYWLWKTYPFDFSQSIGNRVRVPASEMIHGFISERVAQTRGYSWLTASLYTLHMLGAYQEAEVIAARIAASKMGFFTQSGDSDQGYTGDRQPNGDISMSADPGTFEQLPLGVDLKPWDPQHPNSAFPSFIESSLRSVLAGLDIAYESGANDRKGVNYSSIRAGLLDERDSWKMLQQFVIDSFCIPVYEAWIEAAWLSGQLQLQGTPEDWQAIRWQPRGFAWVDPLKDMQATVLAVQNGYETQSDNIADLGGNFEDVISRLKYEQDYIKTMGVKVGTDTKGVADTASDDQAAGDAGGDGAGKGETNV